eukprot:1218853-Lingulodinium_polyedra.AAC.1
MSAFHPDLPQPGLSFTRCKKLCSPTHVQKAHLRVAVHVVPCPISRDPLLVPTHVQKAHLRVA